jgi:hypothetical protein
LLNLKGKPYSLIDHFPFEEIFRFVMPQGVCYKTGRQVSKTTSLASDGIIKAVSIPNFTTLYVTPLYEQIRRFSTMYVGPFIRLSPVRRLWVSTETRESVLHRTFTNQSQMIFSFALLDADRIRGVSADKMAIDEVQDMSKDHLPIIAETMSHSDWSFRQFTGTPKTLDNTLEGIWQESSQAEWFIPCLHCTTDGTATLNIPSMDHHLDRMIGPWHADISEKHPATICYKCAKPISPRMGRWVHRYPRRIATNAGYHVPQIIMPLHYAKRDKWAELLAKQQGKGNTPTNVFYNEVLGESYDTASKLVTLTELLRAMTRRKNSAKHARSMLSKYPLRIMGVDWGGGGSKGLSFTTAVLLGFRIDGRIDALWGTRLLTPHDHIREARELKWFWDYFHPQIFAHDYTGAGNLRETFMQQSGVPQSRLMPCMYVRSAKQRPCYHVAPTLQHPRDHYRVDKARTLQTTCNMIRLGRLTFWNEEKTSNEEPGLIRDFLSLIEEKTTTMAAGEVYKIDCAEGCCDDFAQAVNIGCVAGWYRTGRWPDLIKTLDDAIKDGFIDDIAPEEPDWDDADGYEPIV